MPQNRQYTILVVDDAQDMQMLLDFDLSPGYLMEFSDNGQAALDLLTTTEVDLILLDMYMPGLSGLETLKKLKSEQKTKMIPVIMLSASNDEDEVVAALELGAGDYVTKPYVAKILLARMRTAIRLKEKTEALEYLAKTDQLTGINNRGNFFELSSNAINLANRSNNPIVIAMLDIDFFKAINDNYGHDVGDKVLSEFSLRLTDVFRDYDILGRIGGEEFAVCLPNTTNDEAKMACERLRKHIEEMHIDAVSDNGEDIVVNVTVSIGFILANGNAPCVDELLKLADQALYHAKRHGRNQVVDAQSILNSNELGTDNSCEQTITCDSDRAQPIPNIIASEENNMATEDFEGIDFQAGVDNVLGDEDLYKEILIMFYQDHHLDAGKLENAIETGDTASAKHIAHTLKGVSASVGATSLFEATREIDHAINENDTEKFDSLLAILKPEFSKVMKGIEVKLDVS